MTIDKIRQWIAVVSLTISVCLYFHVGILQQQMLILMTRKSHLKTFLAKEHLPLAASFGRVINGLHKDQHKIENTLFHRSRRKFSKKQRYKAHRLNNTRKASSTNLVFNRVPKAGSETIIKILELLSVRNNFTTYLETGHAQPMVVLPEDKQKEIVEMIDSSEKSIAYAHHISFINFTAYNRKQPIYINMVRDPVERVISWYYYLKTPWMVANMIKKFYFLFMNDDFLREDFETCVAEMKCWYPQGRPIFSFLQQNLFFCGQEQECRAFNQNYPLEKAKENVEKYYAVVGVLEEFNMTLQVLEHFIPKYFKGATELYAGNLFNISRTNKNVFKPKKTSTGVKDYIRKNFTKEIEFYEFCKRRLYTQYRALL